MLSPLSATNIDNALSFAMKLPMVMSPTRSPKDHRKVIMRSLARGDIYDDGDECERTSMYQLPKQSKRRARASSDSKFQRFVPMDAPLQKPMNQDIRQTDFVAGTDKQINSVSDKVYTVKIGRQEELKKTLRRRFLNLDPYGTLASFDKDGSGCLNKDELRLGMTLLGMELLLEDCAHIFESQPKNTNQEASLRGLEKAIREEWRAEGGMVDTVDAYEGTMRKAKVRQERKEQQKKRKEVELLHARAVRHQKERGANTKRSVASSTVASYLMRVEEKEQKRALKKKLQIAAERASTMQSLKESALFAGLPSSLMKEVAHVAQKVRYPMGGIVMNQGDDAESLMCIVSGVAMLADTDASGKHAEIQQLKSGDLMGEVVLYEDTPKRTADVRICSEGGALVVSISKLLIDSLCKKFPVFKARVKQQKAEYLQHGNKTFRNQHRQRSASVCVPGTVLEFREVMDRTLRPDHPVPFFRRSNTLELPPMRKAAELPLIPETP
jgi:hypothetical protein